MANVDRMSLFKRDEPNVCVRVSRDDPGFYVALREFLERGDCVLVLSLDNMTEIGLAMQGDVWQVVTHEFGTPSIFDQLKPE